MQLEISLFEEDLRDFKGFLDSVKFRALTLAARQGLNRAAKGTRTEAGKRIRDFRALKARDIKEKITMTRAKGLNLAKMQSTVQFSGADLDLILFIIGRKSPKASTQPNSRRRPRSFRIIPGQANKRKGLFIEKAKRGKREFQVFRRKHPNSKENRRMVKQSAPSIAHLLNRRQGLFNAIRDASMTRLQKNFAQAFEYQLSKLK